MASRLIPAGSETLDVGIVPVSLTLPPGVEYAIISIEEAPVRWSISGMPTSTRGIHQGAGEYLEWLVKETEPAVQSSTFRGLGNRRILENIRFVRAAAATQDARLYIEYFL